MKKLLAAAILAFPLLAQTHSETITVEVVDVPVYVYNANGALQNLKKDDFELYVNGKPQPIDYFDPIDFRAPANTEAAPTPVVPHDMRDRRLFLLVLDCAFTQPAAVDRARKAAAAMIDASAPADYFSVATFTSKHGLDVLVPFTNDHAVATSWCRSRMTTPSRNARRWHCRRAPFTIRWRSRSPRPSGNRAGHRDHERRQRRPSRP
jgi:VWFA-related protein